MKVIFFFLTICLLYTQSVFVQNASKDIGNKKNRLYLDPKDIKINDKGIFFNLEGNWLIAEGVSSDNKGIYVKINNKSSYVPNDRIINIWVCPRCGNLNNCYSDSVCYKCGEPQPKK